MSECNCFKLIHMDKIEKAHASETYYFIITLFSPCAFYAWNIRFIFIHMLMT